MRDGAKTEESKASLRRVITFLNYAVCDPCIEAKSSILSSHDIIIQYTSS
jgi:hypothetical protein